VPQQSLHRSRQPWQEDILVIGYHQRCAVELGGDAGYLAAEKRVVEVDDVVALQGREQPWQKGGIPARTSGRSR